MLAAYSIGRATYAFRHERHVDAFVQLYGPERVSSRAATLGSIAILLLLGVVAIAAVTALLYFAVAYPTTDGDTIKGTYAMAAVPALALCFGFAVNWLAQSRIIGEPTTSQREFMYLCTLDAQE